MVGLGCPQSLSCSVTSTSLGDAECNASNPTQSASNTTQFIDAPAQPNGSSTYDDMLLYADRNSLVSMLGNGSCQTTW